MISLSCSAILSDMDGTLVDSTACVEAIWERWARKHKIELRPLLEMSHGKRTIDTLGEIAPHLDVEFEARALEAEELTNWARAWREPQVLPAGHRLVRHRA